MSLTSGSGPVRISSIREHSDANCLVVAGAHTLASLALLDYFCRSFGLSERLLLVHAPLVVAALLAALIIAGTVAHLAGHRRGALYFAALFPSIAVTVLFALDIASFATNRWLAVSLTRSLVKLWLQAWWDGEQLLPGISRPAESAR